MRDQQGQNEVQQVLVSGCGCLSVCMSACSTLLHLSFGYGAGSLYQVPGTKRKRNTTAFAQHLRGWSGARGSTCGTSGRPTPAQQQYNSSRQQEISNHSNHTNPVIHDIGRGTVNNFSMLSLPRAHLTPSSSWLPAIFPALGSPPPIIPRSSMSSSSPRTLDMLPHSAIRAVGACGPWVGLSLGVSST